MTKQGEHGIAWTDATTNPLRFRNAAGETVWACVKVSAGCTNCYAETLAERLDKGGPFNAGVTARLTPYLEAKEIQTLLTSTFIRGRRVFPFDMTDVFGDWVPDGLLDTLFAVMAIRADVTWQVLTKRPERAARYLAGLERLGDRDARIERAARELGRTTTFLQETLVQWPLPNVHIGTSVEDQAAAEARLPWLVKAPAAVRFVSYEPALGPVNFRPWFPHERETGQASAAWIHGIDWLIYGGESARGARPAEIAWACSAMRQCKEAGARFFMKQLGDNAVVVSQGRAEHVPGITARAGKDPREWPEELRVREFPREAVWRRP